MKWFAELETKFKDAFFKTLPPQNLVNLQKGKELYLSSRFDEALLYLDNAVNSEYDPAAYELRAKCFQNLNYHSKAIEDFDKVIEENPLEFSYYYSRAVSKNAVSDLDGQIEDLQNCIHYYKKSKNIENAILKKLETDLITAGKYLENVRYNISLSPKTPYLEIKKLIRDCLSQIRHIRITKNLQK
ncbi:tetratricopeptide repeat protein [Flavobacterium gelatinilyticum]|uniref:tetratricopeptide repeat protein n=1 Tax=Flavobacterium gelatinilyticum TaxID=3003260 RepID=UPI002481054F|nr:hypothetical protein [Flavobacterium gelatinilyticum]